MNRYVYLGYVETRTFWSSGLRIVSSDVWFWEATGENITDFHWAAGFPGVTSQGADVCLGFSSYGWEDEFCQAYIISAICQPDE